MATHARGLNSLRRSILLLGLAVAVCCVTMPRAAAAELYSDVMLFSEYDLSMYVRPEIPVGESIVEYPAGLKELWFKALDRPHAELQRMVIDTLAIAHRRGVEGLTAAQPRLLELSKDPNQDIAVLRSIAQTLVVMEAREHADTLAELALQHGASIGQIVEPALAQWKSTELQQAWLERVTKANSSQTMMTLAINGLGMLDSTEATEPIKKLLYNTGESLALRLAAARVLGQMYETGLVDVAQRLLDLPSRPRELHPLLAIQLLGRHDDPEAIEFLTKLIADDSTVVQSESLERLYEIDIQLVDKHADSLISSVDVNVRRWVAKAMFDTQDKGRIEQLCSLLDDVNPTLRRDVSAGLIKQAEIDALRGEIIERTTEVLNRDQWRGCEQAVVVLTRLDHKPSGQRMVELLGHDRGDVQVAAAWGLSELRLKEHLPDMLDHAQSVYEGFKSGQLNDRMRGASRHVAHLFIAFGDHRYREADPLLRKYIPKDYSMGQQARPAACWALGMIYEDDVQEDLVPLMVARLNDDAGPEAEDDDVRWMCANALGRMKAESAIPDLRKHRGTGSVGYTCCWALERMTGEKPLLPKTEKAVIREWFLMPVPER